jgi:hypothetical protein
MYNQYACIQMSRNGRKWILLLSLIALITTFICSWYWASWSIPNNPDQLVLYSINGSDYPKGKEPKTAEKFARYPLLGKVEITDAKVRRELMSVLRLGVAQHYGAVAKCFWPRHAIRIITNGRTIDYIICFECEQIIEKEGEKWRRIPTTDSARDYFNSVLQQHGIPLAPFHIDRVQKENEDAN